MDKGAVGAVVKLRTDGPCDVTAFITKEAVEDLDIKTGDRVTAVVKSTEIMIGKE